MNIAGLISDLIEAGTSAELVGRVAQALASREIIAVPVKDVAAERRRAADRERKETIRRLPQISAESADLPCPEVSEVSQTLPNLPNPNPSKKPPLQGVKKGSRLSADWRPSDEDRSTARAMGFTDSQAQIEFDRFRDFWIGKPGKDGVKLDWSATLRNWLRSTAERKGIAPSLTLVATGPPKPKLTREEIDAQARAFGIIP